MATDLTPTMASTSTMALKSVINSSHTNQTRKRPRVSWTEEHSIIIEEAGGSRRRCSHCNITWYVNTSIGTIAKHLVDKHGVTTPQTCNPTTYIQLALYSNKLLLTRALEKKHDTSIAKYIVRSRSPHAHVKDECFLDFIYDFAPDYMPKSPHTIKRIILRMYVVVRQSIIKYLSFLDCNFGITFDGWSTNSTLSFFPVTLHWVDPNTCKLMSMLLDFLNVFPGDGVGLRCGEALFLRLK